jgi:hypothetical protein
LALALCLACAPVHAVVIQDSLWQSQGGTQSQPWAGFGANLKLAAEPQFRAVLALSRDGETWGEASGIWIGNDAGHAYLLTSAHIFEIPPAVDTYVVRAPDGKILHADKVWMHPQWGGDFDTRTGHDLVILRLAEPLHTAGPPPALYDGDDEAGQLITFVGFGSRGIGSTGEEARFYRGSDKAAAQGVVDQVVDLLSPLPADADGGNYLGVWLPRADGSLANPYGGSRTPATPLVGLLGSGDSGGGAWMSLGASWVVVGVNSNGSGNASYGDTSWFTRVSAQKAWIQKIFPGAHFNH